MSDNDNDPLLPQYGGSRVMSPSSPEISRGRDPSLSTDGRIVLRHHSEPFWPMANKVAAVKLGLSPKQRKLAIDDDMVGEMHDHRNAGVRSSVLTLMNSALGASLLVLPFGSCVCVCVAVAVAVAVAV